MNISATAAYRASALSAFLLAAFAVFSPAVAQQSSMTTISALPTHPAPGESVHVTAHSAKIDPTNAHLTWSADGKALAEGVGETHVDFTMPTSGKDVEMELEVKSSSGNETVRLTLESTRIDLLIESDSYVPPFFRGRALPLTPAHVLAQAIPHFKRSGGSTVPIEQIHFTWRVNGAPVPGASGKGKSYAILPAPALFATDRISVEATTDDGSISDAASVQIASARPLVALHQDHPLFGILFHQSLPSTSSHPAADVALVAIPYFAAVAMPNDIALRYVWRVNNTQVTADPDAPQRLDLSQEKDTTLLITLETTHAASYFYQALGEWRVSLMPYSGGPDGTIPDPFRGEQQ